MSSVNAPQFNSVAIIGRLTANAEVSTTAQGGSICRTAIAVEDGLGKHHKVYFFHVTAFGKLATKMSHLLKGCPVVIHGKLTQYQLPDGEGKTKHYTQITALSCDHLDWSFTTWHGMNDGIKPIPVFSHQNESVTNAQ